MHKTFNKRISNQLKAFAMALMLIHHLWNQNGLERYEDFNVEALYFLKISLLCKICVGIYMFVAGYGLMLTYENKKFKLFHRLKKILFPFWFLMLVCIPILLIWHDYTLLDILSNAILLSCSINGSWWFMQTYVIFLCLFPLFATLVEKRKVYSLLLLVLSIFCFQQLGNWVRPYSESIHYILHYFPLLYAGILVRHYKVFDRIQKCSVFQKIVISLLLILPRLVTGLSIANIGLIIFMILWMVELQSYIPELIKKIFDFLAVISMNMWLVHQFIIDDGVHLQNPIADLGWVYVQSIFAGYFIFKLYNLFENLFISKKYI